jgi:hypothetical protein
LIAGISSGRAILFGDKIRRREFENMAPSERNRTMIADSFDPRTLANMEVALERACQALAKDGDNHEARRHVASRILKRAKGGDRTLGGLTKAGRAAASGWVPHKVA